MNVHGKKNLGESIVPNAQKSMSIDENTTDKKARIISSAIFVSV